MGYVSGDPGSRAAFQAAQTSIALARSRESGVTEAKAHQLGTDRLSCTVGFDKRANSLDSRLSIPAMALQDGATVTVTFRVNQSFKGNSVEVDVQRTPKNGKALKLPKVTPTPNKTTPKTKKAATAILNSKTKQPDSAKGAPIKLPALRGKVNKVHPLEKQRSAKRVSLPTIDPHPELRKAKSATESTLPSLFRGLKVHTEEI